MTVWTIDAQLGTGGRAIARALAAAAGVSLVEMDDGESGPSRAVRSGLVLGAALRVAPELVREVRALEDAHAGRMRHAREQARRPCVILGHAAGAALDDHPGAVHVALHAPLAWRVERHAAAMCIPREPARTQIARADRLRCRARGRAGGARAHGTGPVFHLVCDASLLPPGLIVDVLLAAAGRPARGEQAPPQLAAAGAAEQTRRERRS
jgi:hypothetical protein